MVTKLLLYIGTGMTHYTYALIHSPQHPPIRGEPGNGDSYVIINGKDFLLVRGEFRRGPLQCHQHHMCLGLDSNGC